MSPPPSRVRVDAMGDVQSILIPSSSVLTIYSSDSSSRYHSPRKHFFLHVGPVRFWYARVHLCFVNSHGCGLTIAQSIPVNLSPSDTSNPLNALDWLVHRTESCPLLCTCLMCLRFRSLLLAHGYCSSLSKPFVPQPA